MKAKAVLKLGILGCGAITNRFHLPASVAHPDVRIALLVDANIERARALRASYGLACEVSADYRDALKYDLDVAINALPNALHTAVNVDLLSAGIHVLCEKPLAPTLQEATTCCDAAESGGAILAVGMVRRFHPSTILMSNVLKDGFLGSVSHYEWDLGVPYNWDTASGFYFFRQYSGGGVLLDEGIHDLDLVMHWFGASKILNYKDDDWGSRIESNAVVDLEHVCQKRNLAGKIRLSRTYTLKNRLIIWGTQGTAEILRADPTAVFIRRDMAGEQTHMTLRLPSTSSVDDPFLAQLDDFLKAVRGKSTPAVSGRQALATIDLIQRCYSQATRISEPWLACRTEPNGKHT